MIFSYQAKDQQGRTVTGALDATDERQAAHEIRDMGYFPMRVTAQAAAGNSGNEGLGQGGYGGAAATFSPGTGYTGSSIPAPAPMSLGRWLLVHLVYSFWSGIGLLDMALMYRQFATMLGAGVPIYQVLSTLTAQTGSAALRRVLGQVAARVQNGEKLTLAMAEFPGCSPSFTGR